MRNRIGIIAEDDSDVDVVDQLIPKVVPGKEYSIRKFVGHGCGRIQGKCAQWAIVLKARGCTMLIVLHDLDTRVLSKLESELRQILGHCPIQKNVIVIPIREIEAWLLSDNVAIQKAMNLGSVVPRVPNPQNITDPKKKLGEIIYLRSGKRKRYLNSVDNRKIAAEIDLNNLRRCSSFVPMEEFLSLSLR